MKALAAREPSQPTGPAAAMPSVRAVQRSERTSVQAPSEPESGPIWPVWVQRQGIGSSRHREPEAQKTTAVSSPGDAFEVHADAVASRVLRGTPPALRPGPAAFGVSRAAGASAPGGGAFAAGLPPAVDRVLAAPHGGTPIPSAVRRRVEPHVGADLGAVRVRTGPRASVAAASLGARAFTAGSTIVLGRGESVNDTRLMAHEATHVAQQAGAPGRHGVHRATIMRDVTDLLPDLPDISVTDLVPQWILDGVTDAVRSIPGYTLLIQLIGTDPLTGAPVEVDRQAMMDELLSYGPFGAAVGQVLQAMDALGDVVTVVTDTLAQYGLTSSRLEGDIAAAWAQFSIGNGIEGNVAIVRGVIDGILADVQRFVTDLTDRILAIVREAVLDLVAPLLEQNEAIGPVWSLAKKIFHYDPLRGLPVEAPTVDILADFLHLIGQGVALDQMRERGTLQETADWLDTQLETFLGLLEQATTLFSDAWAAIQPENLGTLLETLPGLVEREFALVVGVGTFAGTVLLKVIELVKHSLLGMLSDHAYSIPGFRLVSVIIGHNPFTGEEVPLTAENLIGGFITLMPGGEATYQQLSETGVIGEAAARIESAMATLGITGELITSTFLGLWNTLSLEDLLAPIDVFERVVGLFGEPIARIFEFITVVVQVVIELVLRLMNFPSDLLASIITQTVQAITDIQRDPVGFLLRMLEALKAGFQGFFDNVLGYLLQGLVSWLFRGLAQLGITIPTEISFASILGLVLEVLGLSVDFVWRKLGEHLDEDQVAMIRDGLGMLGGAWAFIQDIEARGIVAIWEYVVDKLSTLWSTILSMATEWIMTTIIVNGTVKLLTFLDPSGVMTVVNSCIAFFEAVRSAIEYIHDMLEIVNMYVSTFAAVARGDITPGAQMIEQGLAAAIPVAIGFLAAQLGLGGVPERIAEIIKSIRDVVEAAIDWLIEQALRLGAAALTALGAGGGLPAADPGAEPVTDHGTVDEWFEVNGERHHLYVDTEADLSVASDPTKIESIGGLKNLVASWRALSPTGRRGGAGQEKIRAIKAELRKNWEAWGTWKSGDESPMTGHAPNIGSIRPHKEQGARWRPQNVRGGALPSWFPAWELESEHMIPRAQADTYFVAVGVPGVSDNDYKDMKTIMLYRGASQYKTYFHGDNVILSQVRSRVSAIAAGATTGGQLMQQVTQVFSGFAHEAALRAKDAVESEDRSHEINDNLTNGEIRGEPAAPTEAQLQDAYIQQAAQVDAMLRSRLQASGRL